MKEEIIVEIKNLKCAGGYYSFDYIITRSSKKTKQKDSYSSDFDSMGDKAMKKLLESGYAVELALENAYWE